MLYIILMCISHFIFFVNDLLLVVYLIFIEMMLDKKQIQAIFLIEFKMGCKAVETTYNINNAFGPATAKEHTMLWWFKKFCKGDQKLEDKACSGQP